MVIACLGWGSIVWDPQGLPIRDPWLEEGPLVQVEFMRQSNDGRITLVLVPSVSPVPSLWAKMQITDLNKAIKSLQKREKIPNVNNIGFWSLDKIGPGLIIDLPLWAKSKNIQAVVWTGLRPKFNGKEMTPTKEVIVKYLGGLTGKRRALAEEYIRRTPRQINTEYRREIEAFLGWAPVS